MAVQTQRNDIHFSIRVPGWLIAAAFLGLLAWWLIAKTPWDTGGGISGLQPMATLFAQSNDGQTWSGSVLLESERSIDGAGDRWFVANADRSVVLPLSARTTSAPSGTSGVVVELLAVLPTGFQPAYLVRDGFTVLQQSLERTEGE